MVTLDDKQLERLGELLADDEARFVRVLVHVARGEIEDEDIAVILDLSIMEVLQLRDRVVDKIEQLHAKQHVAKTKLHLVKGGQA